MGSCGLSWESTTPYRAWSVFGGGTQYTPCHAFAVLVAEVYCGVRTSMSKSPIREFMTSSMDTDLLQLLVQTSRPFCS